MSVDSKGPLPFPGALTINSAAAKCVVVDVKVDVTAIVICRCAPEARPFLVANGAPAECGLCGQVFAMASFLTGDDRTMKNQNLKNTVVVGALRQASAPGIIAP